MGKINKLPSMERLKSTVSSVKGDLKDSQEVLQENKQVKDLSSFEIEYIKPSYLKPMPFNRKIYTVDDLDFIGATIQQFGLLQPLVVQATEDPEVYYIVVGERRFQSYLQSLNEEEAKHLYAKGFPCRVLSKDMDESEVKLLLLITNATARRNMTATQQINELKAIVETLNEATEKGIYIGYSLKDIAIRRLNVSERQLQKYQSTLNLIEPFQEIIGKEDLNLTAAIGAKPEDVQQVILDRWQSEGGNLEDIYNEVNQNYKSYKEEKKAYDEEIKALKAEIASLRANQENDPTQDNKKEIKALRSELSQKKAERKEHKENLKEKIKQKKADVQPDTTKDANMGYQDTSIDNENYIRPNKTTTVNKNVDVNDVNVLNPCQVDPFLLQPNKALDYIEVGLRSLRIHSKNVDTYDYDRLQQLSEEIASIKRLIDSSHDIFNV